MTIGVRRGYADTAVGQLHYTECGFGDPVVLLHQTPRSCDEYREVLPLLGRTHRAIAVDTAGFGASVRLGEHSIEAYAGSVLAFLDAMDLHQVTLVGHHTGGVVAVEVVAQAPGRVERLVLSSTPYVDAEGREARRQRPPIDQVEVAEDGGHLLTLWNRRRAYYPSGRPDLLSRFVRDALALDEAELESGHSAVAAYVMEDRIDEVRCPVLCISAGKDPHAFPELARLTQALPHAQSAVIEEGMVPLMEEHPSEVVHLITAFIG